MVIVDRIRDMNARRVRSCWWSRVARGEAVINVGLAFRF
jgi:hypothetical protein